MYASCDGSNVMAMISTVQLLLAGWGWVVVFSCFFQNLLVDGTLCSFGTMYVYLMEEFKSTSLQTSAILSVQLSLQALLSKFSTYLTMSYFEISEYTQSMIACNILTGYLWEFWSNICIADTAILQA